MIDIFKKLDQLKEKNNWSSYRIAKECGLAESTVANVYNRNSIPHVDTLEAISSAFGLSISQFMLEDDEELVPLTEQQKEFFHKWEALSKEKKALVNDFIDILYKANE